MILSPEEYLTSLLTPIVSHPDAVAIHRKDDERGVLLSVDLHQSDMSTVIGRSGATAMAIRNLLRVHGARNKAHVSMIINEPEGATIDA